MESHQGILLALILASFAIRHLVQAQQDQQGFISLDCGLPTKDSPYTEPTTNLKFSTDANFIQSGKSGRVTKDLLSDNKQYNFLRYFPESDGKRNCYNLIVKQGTDYLIRAGFYYGNYDGQNQDPKFDMFIGPNLWTNVHSTYEENHEIIHKAKVVAKETVEGKEVVQVPDEVIQDMVPLWDDLLEGRFLAPAPHVAKIHVIVNKIWPLGDQSIKIDVFPVNEITVKFRIKDAATRQRILRRGMWNIANIPMVLSKWSPVVEEEEEEEIKVIPMWVIMRKVPHKMFSWKGLGFIASAVGKPKRLHPDTILCTSFEEARVFVEANMTKELPKSHRFKSKLGVDAEVDFIYSWLPDKCSICTKWGHTHKTSKSKVKLLARQDVSETVTKTTIQAKNAAENIVDSVIGNMGREAVEGKIRIVFYNTELERRELWNDLKTHQDSPIIRRKAWIITGDFNEILVAEEHSMYGRRNTVSQGMRDFQDIMHHCNLLDLAVHGPQYTWTNKRAEGLISKKLDRVLTNYHWIGSYPQSYSVFEAGGCSDHLRCRIHLSSVLNRPKRPFKFVNAIAELKGFKPLMENYWQTKDPIFLSTSSLYRFSKKLKDLKPKIRVLAKEKMGNLSVKTKEAYENLCVYQEENIRNTSQQNLDRENRAYARWEHVARLEEGFLKQKSKLHWLQVGDKNNKVFHRAATARDITNSIKEVKCRDGRIVKEPEEIKTEAEGFFKEFLQYLPDDFEDIDVCKLQEVLPFRCSEGIQRELIKEVTAEEITRVLFSMPNDKSPGPDGFTVEFFKAAWPIIGPEFIISVRSFFEKGFLPKGVNTTILALIPKKTVALEMRDYRPISLCNVIYKVISKIIANRLKITLPDFASLNQTAFVKGRLLIENLMLATELVKDYHKDTISSRFALKIDISKAFDSVQWSFLIKTMEAMDFPPTFIHWISLCISTASFSVQVNGELAGYFQSARGLRQGCALSPY